MDAEILGSFQLLIRNSPHTTSAVMNTSEHVQRNT